MDLTFTVPTLFGLEGIVARELGFLEIDGVNAYDGKVTFKGGFSEMARANIAMRSGERVLLNVGEFHA
ncbi:MAG: class I SAM-dependent RNA methyltransferase, partial [Clostridia bacterium]|nr:class I SAM-dependent RNA methyltransferase [Clostridia bacterium]